MADVLIVCVREDEPQAKALAEMFEAAGFSIGGAPAGDGALRSSGAGLVVWSQASIRSRPFLDAAQRVINADKAVVASLIEPPPPSSIGNSPVFDLSNWDGDPNDPALDPLFFAVDRMVSSARAAVGAAARAPEPEPYEPPAPRREPPPPAARREGLPPSRPPPRPAEPPPSYREQRPAPDHLGSEAEHWRAIRDSKDPADFMDYLGRYGPEGAFAEVAELRLKQLTSRSDPPRPAPRQAPPPPPPRQAARPPVRLDPPQRREPPPALRRPDPPRRMPPPSYDRPDLREPPKGEGGALRAFVLIALLGGAALAGGLYFGGGLPDFSGSPSETSDTASTAPPPSPNSNEPADALDQPVGVPIDEAATTSPPARASAITPRDTTRTNPPAPSRTQTAAASSSDTVTPPPTASWTGAASSGGPVSLRPNEQSASTSAPGQAVIQGPSLDAPSTVVASAAPTPRAPAVRQGVVQWAARPSARRVADLYPSRAARQGLGGRVALDCAVRSDLGLSCSVASEYPTGLGFDRAALSASQSYRASPTLSDGSSAVGARTRLVLQFQAPQQP